MSFSLLISPEKKSAEAMKNKTFYPLPKASLDGTVSVEQAISNRRSVRHFDSSPLPLSHISQLLWAAQGITDKSGFRAAPSAGAIYPVTVYVTIRNVTDIRPGLYKYIPEKHALLEIISDDISHQLAAACWNQPYVTQSAANIILTGDYQKIGLRYGERGIQYTHMEIGHISQNIYLACETLGLGTVAIGAFSDAKLKKLLLLPEKEVPLYIMPVGKKQ